MLCWHGSLRRLVAGFWVVLLLPQPSAAQSPVGACADTPKPTWCAAVAGVRPAGWLAQHRSEVMARQGVVTTSQPLAAQVGLAVLQRGGNAIDAGVATAAVLNVVEPMMVDSSRRARTVCQHGRLPRPSWLNG
jgi:gamma-glutamyltranspeptidase / glutathione hydrolase